MRVLSITAAALILLVMMSSSTDGARGRKANRIAKGEWGGMHISLNVTDSSATIEYDCANGEITGPLIVDRRGRFDLKGTHSREHGGPVRINEPDNSQPARYTGWTDGKRMTLRVTLPNRKESVGTFNLTLGGRGRVFKCR